jgi:hypothetical protein
VVARKYATLEKIRKKSSNFFQILYNAQLPLGVVVQYGLFLINKKSILSVVTMRGVSDRRPHDDGFGE